jgi:hypothetical protein
VFGEDDEAEKKKKRYTSEAHWVNLLNIASNL